MAMKTFRLKQLFCPSLLTELITVPRASYGLLNVGNVVSTCRERVTTARVAHLHRIAQYASGIKFSIGLAKYNCYSDLGLHVVFWRIATLCICVAKYRMM